LLLSVAKTPSAAAHSIQPHHALGRHAFGAIGHTLAEALADLMGHRGAKIRMIENRG
jgi:hypothetical protein